MPRLLCLFLLLSQVTFGYRPISVCSPPDDPVRGGRQGRDEDKPRPRPPPPRRPQGGPRQ
ncbi:hypothetical protein C5167_051170 [Papaver somniferum]|uniref:Uncharacterized protein n=1 Tax=Papaver somniferum TaxID=3469 RepID=A0A4Y7KS68_PAPSO|nr:hypothetical protein C5167_051170 [Papaver somniferum]